MAINRVDYPANLTAQADFSAHGELIETRFMDQVNASQWVVAGNIPQGVVLQIGSVVYRADSDTAITGTASDYVKITPSGATAAAAYVASLTGVTWSAQYNGYYDASNNLYLFDEGKALTAGQISAVFGRYLMQQPNGDVHVGGDLQIGGGMLEDNGAPLRVKTIQIGPWDMDTNVFVDVAHGLPDVTKIASVSVIIKLDDDVVSDFTDVIKSLDNANNTDPNGNWVIRNNDRTNIRLARRDSGAFDTASYDSTTAPANRGWVTIWYEA